uniref:C2H2-type domain-containing protein n=1 Tax=Maylandia zebra TaxID=106582 RepID=A0A3P9CTW7_9CICH
MERHNQVAGIVYRNICAEYNLEVPRSKWEMPPRVVENDRAKILWDFQIQTDKMVVANQPDIVVVDKQKKTAVVIDVAVPNDSNIRKKEHEKLEKYQGLREELERMWRVKVTVVPVVIGALGAVTPKLGEWLQQIPGITSEISVQKSAVLGTAKILRRTLKLPGLCFSHSGNRNRHEHTHMEGNYSCDQCDKSFRNLSSYSEHKRSHVTNKLFHCYQCAQTFTSLSLKRHKRVHTGEKPYKCRHCDKSFSDSGNRNRHERTHMEGNYSCDQCDKSFRNLSSYSEHKRSHVTNKLFHCYQCAKTFTSLSALCKHQRDHSGLKSLPSLDHSESKETERSSGFSVRLKKLEIRLHRVQIESFKLVTQLHNIIKLRTKHKTKHQLRSTQSINQSINQSFNQVYNTVQCLWSQYDAVSNSLLKTYIEHPWFKVNVIHNRGEHRC